MTFDYNELEEKLVEACNEVHHDYMEKFNRETAHLSAGGAKLEAFMHGLQIEFESATINFLKKHNIHKDIEAKKRALIITKLYAKRCMDDFSKV